GRGADVHHGLDRGAELQRIQRGLQLPGVAADPLSPQRPAAAASRSVLHSSTVGLIETILFRLFPPLPELLSELPLGRRVTVRGRVLPRDLIESPLTGERCVYYRYLVEEWRRTTTSMGGTEGFWAVTEHDEAIAEFYLHDAGCRAVVAPQHAEVE